MAEERKYDFLIVSRIYSQCQMLKNYFSKSKHHHELKKLSNVNLLIFQ